MTIDKEKLSKQIVNMLLEKKKHSMKKETKQKKETRREQERETPSGSTPPFSVNVTTNI